MEEWPFRIAENLIDRVSGPMKFRLLLQPLMAVIFAIIPYILVRGPVNRVARRK